MSDHFEEAWAELTQPGAQFAMKEIWVRGAPMRVFESAPPSMRDIWEMTAPFADRDYLVFEDEHLTYAEADARVRALAHHLRDVHGVGEGDRVAIAMRNYPEWVLSYWATISLGAACVGMNAWWTTSEMEYGLADSAPKVLIADSERVERVVPLLDKLRVDHPLHLITVRTPGDLPHDSSRWDDVIDPSTAPAGLPPADIDPDDDACIFYTSGTTGSPKGAQLTHRGSVHNLLNVAFMGAVSTLAAQKAGAPKPAPDAVPAPGVFMAPTPLFHVTANNCVLHPATMTGSKLVLTYKWDAGRALELIEREGVTYLSGVPTMSRELLMHPDWATRNTSTLTGLGGGGAPLQPDLVEKIDMSLPQGVPRTGYGLTETHGIVTSNSGARYVAKAASCGRVVPTLDAKLVDESGRDVTATAAHGGVGELAVRGAVVIKGYLNRPEATAEAIEDGWFRTGDIATIDEDGDVFIVDRAKDMVLRGGENIYCSEVEAAIYQHDAVAEAAVFGVPDDRLGEIVGAAIVLARGASMTRDDLVAFLTGSLANFKIPERVWILADPLPRNANGKFMKRELRETLSS
jgi:long-chain acyl-CoA synthetase